MYFEMEGIDCLLAELDSEYKPDDSVFYKLFL